MPGLAVSRRWAKPVTWPQATIALGLAANTVAILIGYWRLRRFLPVLRGNQKRVVSHLWLAAMLPLIEAYVLWEGNFWS